MAWSVINYGEPLHGLSYPGDGLSALIVGTGLTCAAFDTTLDWATLLEEVGKTLGLDRESPDARHDPRLTAFELSWRYARHVRGPNASLFQSAVSRAIRKHERDNPNPELVQAFRRFLLMLRIGLVVDLNYDHTVETLLDLAGIQYRRSIGSEGPPGPYPLDSNAVLVWKVHGAVEAAQTIVLSPSEYQRIYENERCRGTIASMRCEPRQSVDVGNRLDGR